MAVEQLALFSVQEPFAVTENAKARENIAHQAFLVTQEILDPYKGRCGNCTTCSCNSIKAIK